MSAKSSLEDSERIAAIKALAKACTRPVPETLFGAMVIRGTSANQAELIFKLWNEQGWAHVGEAQWGNVPDAPIKDSEE